MPYDFKQLRQKPEFEVLRFQMDALSITKSLGLETWVAFKSLNIKPEWFRAKLVGQEMNFCQKVLPYTRGTPAMKTLPLYSVSNYDRIGYMKEQMLR